MKPIICLTGPSGVGKTSYLQRLAGEEGFSFPIVYVTRSRRRDDGPHVIQVSPDRFQLLQSAGKLLESDRYNGQWYGTSACDVERLRHSGSVKGVVLDLTPSGCRQVKAKHPHAIVITLAPSGDGQWLQERLIQRGTDWPEVIAARCASLDGFLADLSGLGGNSVDCYSDPVTWEATFQRIVSVIGGVVV